MEELISRKYNLEEVNDIAKWILGGVKSTKVLLFKGDLGAGKTTLIKEICYLLGVKDQITSPTYTIVNEYLLPKGDRLYHMDLYRLNSFEEAMEIGIEEMIESGSICIIEWPEIIEDIIVENYITVRIDHLDADRREVFCYFS